MNNRKMIELTFLKEFLVTKQMHQKSVIIFHYWYFLSKGFKFQPYVCNRCHHFFMMSMNLINIVILNIKGFDYHCIISRISKSEAIKLFLNIDLTEKTGML